MEEIAQVYSRALFEAAQEQDKLDDVREQVGEFADAIDTNRDLAVFFFSPYFSTEEKKEGLGKVLDGADDTVRNFLELLVEKHRMPAIHRIRRAYDALWEEERGRGAGGAAGGGGGARRGRPPAGRRGGGGRAGPPPPPPPRGHGSV